MRVLIVNPGSSSLKFSLLDDSDRLVLGEERDRSAAAPRGTTAAPMTVEDRAAPMIPQAILDALHDGDAVGVRVVHGGVGLRHCVVVDDTVLTELEANRSLAPLHDPPAIAAIRELRAQRPRVPVVACPDSAFHVTIPDAAAVYPIPAAWTERWGLRRLGFHGFSHAYAARRGSALLERPVDTLRLVTCHLGAGASVAAVRGGVSVDTTMGFTPMEGLMMATRSGSIDPGIVFFVLRQGGLGIEDVESALEHASGVLGVSTISADMRAVLAARSAGDTRARLAVAMYVHRVRAAVAAMAASAEGIDGLVFTGGVGEHAPPIRAEVCAGLRFLGIDLDAAGNDQAVDGDRRIDAPSSRVAVAVVRAREDLEIARAVRAVLGTGREAGAGSRSG